MRINQYRFGSDDVDGHGYDSDIIPLTGTPHRIGGDANDTNGRGTTWASSWQTERRFQSSEPAVTVVYSSFHRRPFVPHGSSSYNL
jgi:hypothetical protein